MKSSSTISTSITAWPTIRRLPRRERGGEHRTVVAIVAVVVGHDHVATAAPADQPHQREAEAATAVGAAGLGGVPLPEHLIRVAYAGSGVVDPHRDRVGP